MLYGGCFYIEVGGGAWRKFLLARYVFEICGVVGAEHSV